MKFSCLLLLVCIGATACVTNPEIKSASSKHKQNLAELDTAVKSLKREIEAYCDDMIALEREAYIAQMSDFEVDRIVNGQITAHDPADTTDTLNRRALDFIDAGAALTNAKRSFSGQFTIIISQMQKLRGSQTDSDDLDALYASAIDKIMQAAVGDQDLMNSINLVNKNPEISTHIVNAFSYRLSKENLSNQLDLLLLQIDVMEAYHGKIDEFLAIDATIDGGRIAEAANAGAAVDLTQYPELAGLLGGLR